MEKIKSILKSNFTSLAFFYRYLRYRIVILILMTILIGLLDSLGLAMFLPLLQLVADQGAAVSPEKMGKLSFIVEGLNALGFQMTLTVVLMTMFFFFVIKGVVAYFDGYLKVIYQQYFIAKIRIENINALSNYSYNAFVNADAGEIQNTLSGEVQRVIQSFNTYAIMLKQTVLIFTYSALALAVDPQFAGLVVLGGLLTNFLFNVLYKKTKRLSLELVKRNNMFQGQLLQSVAFFKYLKATGSNKSYLKNLKDKVYDIEETTRGIGVLGSIMGGIREPLMIGIVVAVILIQVKLIGGGLGSIIISLLLFYRGLSAITGLQTSYNKYLGFSGSLTNMQKFIAHLKKNKQKNGKVVFETFKNQIELKNISFAFNSDELILKDINLIIKKDESLAFVGESGSGKTTLMNIMSGLLSPTQGKYIIDKNDSSDLNITSFQKKIGYITQEPVIFDDTVFNNVTFWSEKSEENLKRFWEALRKAHVLQFVKEHKLQEDARLGNNGINLSGGQKQRISIARELYKDIDFLFLDEATSALDSETEKEIQNNIDKLKGEFTIIIIAHRLSTIKNVDRVVVLNKGKIEQTGNYTDLIQKSDSFKRMVHLQEL